MGLGGLLGATTLTIVGDGLGISDVGADVTGVFGKPPLQNPHEVTHFFPTSEAVLPSSAKQ
jgi:hypothetical protein